MPVCGAERKFLASWSQQSFRVFLTMPQGNAGEMPAP